MSKKLVIDSSVLIPLSRRRTLKAYLERKRMEENWDKIFQ